MYECKNTLFCALLAYDTAQTDAVWDTADVKPKKKKKKKRGQEKKHARANALL